MDRQHPLDPYTKPTSSGESDSDSTTNNTNVVSEDKDYSEGGDTDSSINDYSEDEEATASGDAESMSTDVSSDQESENDNENWVFDRFKHFSQEQEEQWTLKEKREEFRSNYANFLEWYSHLKKNATVRKIHHLPFGVLG